MTGERDFLVGKRVTVIGLGIEGVDVARYAAAHGASVTVTDSKSPDALAARIRELEGLPITYALANDGRQAVADSDVAFVSQSVPLDAPAVHTARERGIPVSSMTRWFFERCPGPTIGITGSSGKSTTTSLVAAMLDAGGLPHIVGGNIGTGLLGLLDGMDARTWAVVEISHTQLQLIERGPHIAGILNITPNHLDRFTWEEYVALKQRIVRGQTADDYVVLNLHDALSPAIEGMTLATAWYFTPDDDLPGNGTFVRDGALFVRRDAIEEMLLPAEDIPLRGAHTIENVLAAAALAALAAVSGEDIARAVRAFRPVPHRLEFVAEVDGVRYVNDSIASTPERALAGMRSFVEPLVLLLGGKDKDLPKEELAEEALRRCTGIVFFGADGPLLEAAIEAQAMTVPQDELPQRVRVATIEEAVRAASEIAETGDVVLLSPACTSFDAYANFEERGEEFRRLVRALASEAEAS
jgi:UDP-N-acetylmuramoylalanine--D-glutamate ligase